MCTSVHWCARICVCVPAPVLPIVVHSNYTLYYLGLSSQQAHLEIRFKTAVNTEIYGEKKGKGSDFKIVLSGVVPNHNWASG